MADEPGKGLQEVGGAITAIVFGLLILVCSGSFLWACVASTVGK